MRRRADADDPGRRGRLARRFGDHLWSHGDCHGLGAEERPELRFDSLPRLYLRYSRRNLRQYFDRHRSAARHHHRDHQQFGAGWKPPEEDQIQLIAGLRKAQHWDDAVQTMVEYLKTPQSRAPFVRLALAQVLVEQLGRPRQALKVLARLDPKALPASHQATFTRLKQRAQQAAEEDPFEITADDW